MGSSFSTKKGPWYLEGIITNEEGRAIYNTFNKNRKSLLIEMKRGTIPIEVFDLEDLKELTIIGEGITEIPPQIGQLKNLEELTIMTSNVKHLPDEVFELTKLKSLKLRLGIETLSPKISNLTNLYSIDLSFCQLKELPDELGDLRKLHTLIFAHTPLTKLPSTFFGLENLIFLDISNCREIVLEEEIKNMKTLSNINYDRTIYDSTVMNRVLLLSRAKTVTENVTKLISILKDFAKKNRRDESVSF